VTLTTASNETEFVFILGITHRSGTNFLSDLVTRHPDCEKVRTIWEDFLLANSDKLDKFVSAVAGCWNRDWDPDGSARLELAEHLGRACLHFLTQKTSEVVSDLPRYLVTKTPSVDHLDLVPMFPGARAIVIVRDGRAVVESSVRSFGWDFETVAYQWAAAADVILSAQKAGTPFLLVRYEDLVLHLKDELTRIFSFLEIESATYDFDAALSLPVRGSSMLRTDKGAVHWGKTEKPADFDPLERWKTWTTSDHQRCNSIAGDQMSALGYDLIDKSHFDPSG
jgi:hypothetical protein